MDYLPPPKLDPPAHVQKLTPPKFDPPTIRNLRTVGYPVRGNLWTGCGSWQHMDSGEHRGKFPRDWLASLSWAELQSLHSDDHEGRVKWEYVPGRVVKRVVSAPVVYLPTAQNCPNGVCPLPTRSSR